MTKDLLATYLAKEKSIRTIPSPHSLAALCSKNVQIVMVGSEKVENAVGVPQKHAVYDVNRELIKCKEDIVLTRATGTMTPKEKREAKKCPSCGRVRLMPKDSEVCLWCVRNEDKNP